MSKFSFRKLVVVASLVCLPVTASFATNLNVGVGQSKTFSLSCKSGNFTGIVEGVVGNHYQAGKWVHTTRYKITRSNGQKGGNKANINLYAGKAPHFVGDGGSKSPDSMKQDGNWHNITLQRGNMGLGASLKGEAYFQFVFDKSLADPDCYTSSVYF